ncbi:MAG: DNRLRE domain-containing protein [Armatimonadota bacterium]|nr:DNRLRE domain-containing protein [bacterium]
MKTLTAIALATTLVVALSGGAIAASVSLHGDTATTQVDNLNPNTNYGTGPQITTYGSWSNSAGKWQYMNTYWYFDLSSLANFSGSNITSATLSLVGWQSWANGTPTIDVYRITEGWTENGATWNSRDGVNAWTTPGGTYTTAGSVEYVATAPTSTVNVTNIVQAWANGQSNYGFLLHWNSDICAGSYIYNNHKNTWNPNELPTLAISYAPVPEPSSVLALLVGVTSLAGGLIRRRK